MHLKHGWWRLTSAERAESVKKLLWALGAEKGTGEWVSESLVTEIFVSAQFMHALQPLFVKSFLMEKSVGPSCAFI